MTRGTTYENRANLAPGFHRAIVRQYEGTRLGRQEIEAELLDDAPGGLWNRGVIEAARVGSAPDLARIVVAIDPAASSGEDADETGIIVAGKDGQGHGWVLADLSGRYAAGGVGEGGDRRLSRTRRRPDRRRGQQWRRNGRGDVAGDRPERLAFAAVHASRGKIVRAEPMAACTSRAGSITSGPLPQLEDQMCSLSRTGPEPGLVRRGYSPDRVDALVWALTDLLVEPMPGQGIYEAYRRLSGQLAERPRRKPGD